MLSVLRKELGSLNHIKRLVKANGFVVVADPAPASVGGRHPEMMNGFSETMMEIFGERGKGARSVVGVASLPRGWTMEVDAVFELHDNL
jgi:enamine deaminase RidA (YjgF/YER057c/UK114 family)